MMKFVATEMINIVSIMEPANEEEEKTRSEPMSSSNRASKRTISSSSSTSSSSSSSAGFDSYCVSLAVGPLWWS